jgi:hypothetical protein
MDEPPVVEDERRRRGQSAMAKLANDCQGRWCNRVRELSPELMTLGEAARVASVIWRMVRKSGIDPATYDPDDEIRRRLAARQHMDPFDRMTKSAKGRSSSQWAVVDWVSQHLLMDPREIDDSSVPSQGAPALLKWARENQKEFYSTWGKRMEKPDESGVDSEVDKALDGTSVHEILDQFERLMSEQESRERRAEQVA